MNLSIRKELLKRLGEYLKSGNEKLQEISVRAENENGWFTQEFITRSLNAIAENYLSVNPLENIIKQYQVPDTQSNPKKVGIVMAGNIPLVGFHDLMCTFLSGHIAMVKLSSKDKVLMEHVIDKLFEWNTSVTSFIQISERLNNCDAYIATGSNNTSRYFEYYFGKYPHIIRRNRTSVAVLTGKETTQQLEYLADDVFLYFGLGCRNVTKIYVPHGYDFVNLLAVFKKYAYLADHNKYKNNYDYNLALNMLNQKEYMTNESVILVEEKSFFSRISQLHYEYYSDMDTLRKTLNNQEDLQTIIGDDYTDFGAAQQPQVCEYADNVDTMQFLLTL